MQENYTKDMKEMQDSGWRLPVCRGRGMELEGSWVAYITANVLAVWGHDGFAGPYYIVIKWKVISDG